MNTLFSSCLEETDLSPINRLELIQPQPTKYRVANALKLVDFAVRHMVEPRKKEKYVFPRGVLRFLSNQNCHVPIVYFPSVLPKVSQIIVYCHGSSSNLNNVYDFANSLSAKYGVAVLAYDYTGDGESQKEFFSYEEDIRLVLAWVLNKGYKLSRTIICGFSLGSYAALVLQGQMPRILISPVCGIMAFLEGEAKRYEGQKYGTIPLALKLAARALIVQCTEEIVHISHGELLTEALMKDNQEDVIFHRILDQRYEHRSAPSFLNSRQGEDILRPFMRKIAKESGKEYDAVTKRLQKQLIEAVFYHSEGPGIQHLTEKASDKKQ